MNQGDDRYRRQKAFAEVGEAGQAALLKSRVAICGMGALGAMVAERLCRMGVGYLRLIDRDWVELDNLPRQTLYTTQDAMRLLPKSIAAQSHLLEINPDVIIEPIVSDLNFENAESLLSQVDCIVDGTDNFETRYLINDFAWKYSVPWVHAGVVGASGQSMAFVPKRTSCFRCLLPDLPSVEHMQTCDATGVLGKDVAGDGYLRVFDLWHGEVRKIRVSPDKSCPVCVHAHLDFLSGILGSRARVLCGRGAVQIHTSANSKVDLVALAERLRMDGEVKATPFMIRFNYPPHTISVFADGRTVIQGTRQEKFTRDGSAGKSFLVFYVPCRHNRVSARHTLDCRLVCFKPYHQNCGSPLKLLASR
jgi:molybdopterin-synthase adenylyltransferase